MKIASFFWLLSAALSACTASYQGAKKSVDQEQATTTRSASTQGGAEDGWARRVFEEHYRYQVYRPFQGAVHVRGTAQEPVFRYGRDTLRVFNIDERYRPLFTSGTLFPTVLPQDYLPGISSIRELPRARGSTQRRRFTMYVWPPRMMNPTLYVFELTNQRATPLTDWPSFLQGAVLTFIREVGGVI